MKRRRSGVQNQQGFALVIVLVALALLAGIASMFVFETRTHTMAAANTVGRIQAQLLADGGVRLAGLELEKLRARKPARLKLAVPFACRVLKSSEALQMIATDEAGRIDLNTSGPSLLQAFFAGLLNDADAGLTFADRIADFRDGDTIARPNGAEAEAYRTAGLAYGPSNAPFQSVEDLEQVLGLLGDTYRKARMYVTVHNRQSGIDPKHVSPELIEILRRGFAVVGSTPNKSKTGIPPAFVSPSKNRFYRVRSTAILRGRFQFTRDAVVEASVRTKQGMRIHRWMPAYADKAMPVADMDALPPC